jgi:hypothetical protein
MNLSSDAAERRDASQSGATVQPAAPSRVQMNDSPTAGLSSSAAEVSTDLRAPVYELLRRTFRAARDDGSIDVTDPGTHDAVRSICAMARACDIRAETLILAIKAGWRQLPDFRNTTRLDAEVTLAALITMCIKEYYAPYRRL